MAEEIRVKNREVGDVVRSRSREGSSQGRSRSPGAKGLRGRLAYAVLVVTVGGAAALLGLQCGDEGPGPDIDGELVITPENPAVALSSSEQFTATVDGHAATVTWYVDGIRGGSVDDGVITTDGLYIAPAEIPAEDRITISAKGIADTTLHAEATVDLVDVPGAAIVVVSPDSTSVLATGNASFLADVIDCTSDGVTWSLARLSGDVFNPGSIADGLYEGPLAAEENFAIVIEATSFDCPSKTGIARVMVYAPPTAFDVQTEAYTQSYDAPGSLSPIVAEPCGGAVGGKAVLGLDVAGEFIEVPVDVPVSGTYTVTLRFQAMAGDTIVSAVSMEGCGSPVPGATFTSTQGAGIG